MVKNTICEVTHMARGARGSARAPEKVSDLNSPSKIDAFWLFDQMSYLHNSQR